MDNLIKPLCDSFSLVGGARPKIFILEKLIDLSHRVSAEVMEKEMFNVGCKVLDEFTLSKGRAMPADFKI